MTPICVSQRDKAIQRAAVHLAKADQWLRVRMKDGRTAYGIPSATVPGKFHLTTPFECDCRASQVRPDVHCSHRHALRLHLAQVQAIREGRDPEQAVKVVG